MTDIDKDVPKHVYNRRALQYAFARRKDNPQHLLRLLSANGEWLWLQNIECAEPFTGREIDFTLLTAFEVKQGLNR